MTTEKQIIANQENALLSTGATTEEGKSIVAKNAIKHGVFTHDLIISNGDGKENVEEYHTLLDGLIDSLSPENQMEQLLVEKIAVDFWRLKRVLRFEMGNIRKYVDRVIDDYYNNTAGYGLNKPETNEKLETMIAEKKTCIESNLYYMKALKEGRVTFDTPTWHDDKIETNIEDDLYGVLSIIKKDFLTPEEYKLYHEGSLNLEQLKAIFKKAGYTDKDIAESLIRFLEKCNKDYPEKIKALEKQILKNKLMEEISIGLNSLPRNEEAEKVMRYERSLQKSIMQNIFTLKQIQQTR